MFNHIPRGPYHGLMYHALKLSTCFLIVDMWYGLSLGKIERQVLS